MSHAHYFKNVSHLAEVDVYRVLSLFSVSDPCLQHAIKKLLCAGGRGAKNDAKDVQEAIDSLTRWQNMRAEDEAGKPTFPGVNASPADWTIKAVQV